MRHLIDIDLPLFAFAVVIIAAAVVALSIIIVGDLFAFGIYIFILFARILVSYFFS